ncbi:2,3-bisphosphoglycerate-independent phosphoglycerate mutase [Gossypium arboreum]|uniref:2,3-bisphosphoglycerate-independent phosphoglycerate mutase n=1 Tax=Gossypium arboreum TaxID=29729 RepID=A0A0B0MZB8_GOSAR|nr:2,3-bisphosphoglycerate-independent phosphoglycerate mutase [Gossypium arboreum]
MCCGYLTVCVSSPCSYILIDSSNSDVSDGIPSVQRVNYQVYSTSSGWRPSEILSHYQAIIWVISEYKYVKYMACIGT